MQKISQSIRVVRADGIGDRGSRRQRAAPGGRRGQTFENAKRADLIERVEVPEHGSEGGVDEPELRASEPGTMRKLAFDAPDYLQGELAIVVK